MFNQIYWGKLRRKEWLTKGDHNTKFFHSIAQSQRRRNRILRIKNDCGSWIDDPDTIAQHFISDYAARFKSPYQGLRPLPCLDLTHLVSDEDNSTLICMPTLDEIKQALFSIEPNKTPGPDGFGAGFFSKILEYRWN